MSSLYASSAYASTGLKGDHHMDYDAVVSTFGGQHIMGVVHASNMSAMSLPSANDRPMFYLAVYAAIGLFAVVMMLINAVALYTGSYWASKKLFQGLLGSVTHATMRW
jgi:hypothetical protein